MASSFRTTFRTSAPAFTSDSDHAPIIPRHGGGTCAIAREFITDGDWCGRWHARSGSGLLDARAALRQVGAKPGKRREVTISGRRVKTVDLHAHCFVPEVMDLVKDTPLAQTAKGNLDRRPSRSAIRSV